MASPGNQHRVNCIGTLSFPIALFSHTPSFVLIFDRASLMCLSYLVGSTASADGAVIYFLHHRSNTRLVNIERLNKLEGAQAGVAYSPQRTAILLIQLWQVCEKTSTQLPQKAGPI